MQDQTLIAYSLAVIFFLAWGIVFIAYRRAKKRLREEREAMVKDYRERIDRVSGALRQQVDTHQHRIKILEAEKGHQKHLTDQATGVCDVCLTALEQTQYRRDLLTRLLCKVYPIFHTLKHDNSKIEAHLCSLVRPKRKSRRKGKKQAI